MPKYTKYKRLAFYWLASFSLATPFYYLISLIMPHKHAFGAWYRMPAYHWEHPISYILIPCFFYGILANIFAKKFTSYNKIQRIFLTFVIIALTIALSSPFGGMLWHFHDMQAGYFPKNWLQIIIIEGISWGIQMGWVIILLSIPYNVFGSIICYFLTKKGIELFKIEE